MKASGIGGQAVMEGIMMKNGDTYAVAVRKPDNEIVVKKDVDHSYKKREKIRKIPFVRGVFSFIDSLVLGMSTLTFSAEFYEEEEKPSKLDMFLEKVMGGFGEKFMMGVTVALSIILAVGIFMIFPFLLAELLKKVIVSDMVLALIEGVIRVGILLGYIWLISRLEDIKRVFRYHGAEHKCINCIENGMELNVENVMKSSKEHKRCGTSFLLVVMLVSIIFFLFIRVDSAWLRMALRILLIPVIAGVSYEFIQWAGRSESKVVNALSKPGMLLQHLTTSEPDEAMVEVAIKAVEAVFDWREFLEKYPDKEDAGVKQAAAEEENAGKAEKTVKKAVEMVSETEAEKTEEKSVESPEEKQGVKVQERFTETAADKTSEAEEPDKSTEEKSVETTAEKMTEKTDQTSQKPALENKEQQEKKTSAKRKKKKRKNKKAMTDNAAKEENNTKTEEKKEEETEDNAVPEYATKEKKEEKAPSSSIVEDNSIPAPRITEVDDSQQGVIKLSWEKVKKVSGYVIYRKEGNQEIYKMYPDVKKNQFEDREIQKNVTYYYRVRAYRIKDNKRVYGQLSPIESNGYSSRIKSKY